jgi:hypothetical protein
MRDVVNRNQPSLGIVAECALSSVLPPMQVRVTVLTLRWRVAGTQSLACRRVDCEVGSATKRAERTQYSRRIERNRTEKGP